ncbi:hypothetical protein [Amycolatopsis pigmentata]|uniref:DUF1453 domain-containing protein n=1 Tax=Amycolatopsis pigmentata TaxID=450801 RepID=A0ABW5FVZ9_9PSEU
MSVTEILLYLAIAAVVVWRVIIRQWRGSAITVRGLVLIPGILVVIGVSNCLAALSRASAGEIELLVADVVVLIGLGVARAASTTVTTRGGNAFQKGTVLTLLLWLTTIVVRIGVAVLGTRLGVAGPLTSASVVLSMGLSIGVQNAVIYLRARSLGLPVAADRRGLAVRP